MDYNIFTRKNKSTTNRININEYTTFLEDKYKIVKKLGSGSFGDVFLAIDQYTNKEVAIKLEKYRNNKKKSLEITKINNCRVYREYKIYQKIKSYFSTGIPQIYDFVQTDDFYIMVMELLGKNLEDVFELCERNLNMGSILLIADQIMVLIKNFHEAGFIHRDIKPNNFLIGIKNNIDQIYIMDFGLSKRYCVNDKHIEIRNDRSLIGTARYASLNMHNGIEPSRRDDLEAIGYMLIYFCLGKLPWQGLKKKKRVDHLETIGNKKKSISIDVLCENLPNCFNKYLEYCRNLEFTENPDYTYLRKLFQTEFFSKGYDPTYQWCIKK